MEQSNRKEVEYAPTMGPTHTHTRRCYRFELIMDSALEEGICITCAELFNFVELSIQAVVHP